MVRGQKTDIASGKGSTALKSNREKWLGEEKKQTGKNFRGAGGEKGNEKGNIFGVFKSKQSKAKKGKLMLDE